MSLWWLQPGWTDTCCAACGQRIAPEGDPDWGYCYGCYTQLLDQQRAEHEAQQEAEELSRLENAEMERHFRDHPHG